MTKIVEELEELGTEIFFPFKKECSYISCGSFLLKALQACFLSQVYVTHPVTQEQT